MSGCTTASRSRSGPGSCAPKSSTAPSTSPSPSTGKACAETSPLARAAEGASPSSATDLQAGCPPASTAATRPEGAPVRSPAKKGPRRPTSARQRYMVPPSSAGPSSSTTVPAGRFSAWPRVRRRCRQLSCRLRLSARPRWTTARIASCRSWVRPAETSLTTTSAPAKEGVRSGTPLTPRTAPSYSPRPSGTSVLPASTVQAASRGRRRARLAGGKSDSHGRPRTLSTSIPTSVRSASFAYTMRRLPSISAMPSDSASMTKPSVSSAPCSASKWRGLALPPATNLLGRVPRRILLRTPALTSHPLDRPDHRTPRRPLTILEV